MANLVEIPVEEQCLCCEREEPPRARNEILNEYGDKNNYIYSLVSNFFGVSFDMQENFGCYICNRCKLHLQNYFAAKSKVEVLIEAVHETSQELMPDNGGNWSVSNINICIACSERSRKKTFIIQSDAFLSTRKRKQSRPPPKPGEAYRLVSDFYNLSFKTHKSCGSFVCLRCKYRLTRVEEELHYKENLKRDLFNSAQILKPLTDVFISLYDFDTFEEDELPFQRGDHFHALKEGEEFPSWLFALNLSTGLKGYIPSRFVTRHGGELNSEIWFQDVDAKHAEEMLSAPVNRKGSFLVRRTPEGTAFVLSVLVTDPEELKPQILHFKIQLMKNGFYRLPNVSESFSNIPNLIQFYKAKGRCIPCRLTAPCIRVRPPIPFRGFQIKRKAISVNLNKNSKEYLGDGSVGEVYFGLQRKITKIAVKKLKRQTNLNKFVTATTGISKLNHPRLVQLLGVCTDSEPYLIITEYMTNGPLTNFLKEHQDRIKMHFLIKTAIQITDGMQFLESKSYVHRNLRAANILLGDRNQVKISDHGISAVLLDAADISSGKIKTFPELWTAPEALFDSLYTTKSDVWSFGVVLYEMITFTSILPYAELRKEVMEELEIKDPGDESLTIACMSNINEGYRMSQPHDCPDEYYDSMSKCWNEDPDDRPSFSYLFDYFANYELPKEENDEEEESSTPSDTAEGLLTEPTHTKQLYLGSSGYGSFDIKDNLPSASRVSSTVSQRQFSIGKQSYDFPKSAFSSRSGSVVGRVEKPSAMKRKPSTAATELTNRISSALPSDTVVNSEITDDRVDISDDKKSSADDNLDHHVSNELLEQTSSDNQTEAYGNADSSENRKTSALVKKSAGTTPRKNTESRTTSVNSAAKKSSRNKNINYANSRSNSMVDVKSKLIKTPTKIASRENSNEEKDDDKIIHNIDNNNEEENIGIEKQNNRAEFLGKEVTDVPDPTETEGATDGTFWYSNEGDKKEKAPDGTVKEESKTTLGSKTDKEISRTAPSVKGKKNKDSLGRSASVNTIAKNTSKTKAMDHAHSRSKSVAETQSKSLKASSKKETKGKMGPVGKKTDSVLKNTENYENVKGEGKTDADDTKKDSKETIEKENNETKENGENRNESENDKDISERADVTTSIKEENMDKETITNVDKNYNNDEAENINGTAETTKEVIEDTDKNSNNFVENDEQNHVSEDAKNINGTAEMTKDITENTEAISKQSEDSQTKLGGKTSKANTPGGSTSKTPGEKKKRDKKSKDSIKGQKPQKAKTETKDNKSKDSKNSKNSLKDNDNDPIEETQKVGKEEENENKTENIEIDINNIGDDINILNTNENATEHTDNDTGGNELDGSEEISNELDKTDSDANRIVNGNSKSVDKINDKENEGGSKIETNKQDVGNDDKVNAEKNKNPKSKSIKDGKASKMSKTSEKSGPNNVSKKSTQAKSKTAPKKK